LGLSGDRPRDRELLDLIPVNTEDNVLHLILGVTGLAAGAATPAPQVGARTA
jgi:hypothetical protein